MPAMKEIVLTLGGSEIESIPVDKNPFRIGKSPVCELQLSGKGIPRHQCDIIQNGAGYKLIDRSGKGTKIDRKKVDEARLSSKSVIKIGDYRLQLRDIPAGEVSTVTAVFGGTDPSRSKHAKKQVLSLVGKSFLGPVKAVLDGSTFTVGSDPGNDLVLKEQFISKFHCRFYQKNGQWSVEDLDSTNGTKVNGASVSTTKIEPGMVVELGKVKLSVLAGKKDIEYPGCRQELYGSPT
jgi:pSer/pThr/pTyr-binding forkhead associated (FHA) protein